MENNVYPGDQPRSRKSTWIPYSLSPILCWKPLTWFHKISLGESSPPRPHSFPGSYSWTVTSRTYLPASNLPQANPPSPSVCLLPVLCSNNKLHQVAGASAPRIKHILPGQGRANAKILRGRWFSVFAE